MAGDNFSTSAFDDLLKNFDPQRAEAFDELFRYCSLRLEMLAHQLFAGESLLHRWAETDDVLQAALLDLYNALKKGGPTTKNGFFALASTVIRHKILDMARQYRSRGGDALFHHHTTVSDLSQLPTPDGRGTAISSPEENVRLQEAIDHLSGREKELVELLFFGGVDSQTAAEILGVADRTFRQLKRDAMLHVRDFLRNEC